MSSSVTLQISSVDLLNVVLETRRRSEAEHTARGSKIVLWKKQPTESFDYFKRGAIRSSWLHDFSKLRLTPADSIGEPRIVRSSVFSLAPVS